MGNRVRINGKTIGRRGLALLLAVLTTITSWSLDWNALRVQAADNSSELTVATQLSSGGEISMVYTNSNAKRVSVSSVYFKFLSKLTDPATTYSYTVSMIQSGSTVVYTQDATSVTGTGDVITEAITPTTPKKIYLDSMDTLEIHINLASSDGEQIEYYTSPAGDAFAVSVQEESSSGEYSGDMPQATVNITGDGIIAQDGVNYLNLSVGDSVQLGYTIDYAREVTFTSDNASAVVSPAGLVTAAGVGTATITAATSLSTDKKGVLVVQVLDVSLNTTDFAYTGKEVKPADSDYTILGVGGGTTASQIFTTEYAGNVDVGTATVTLTGKGAYAGYRRTLAYTISQKDISTIADKFAQGTATYTINTANSTVSIANVINGDIVLEQDRDFTATAAISRSEIVGNTKKYYYNVTITGIGNYTGSTVVSDVSVSESAGLPIDNFYTYELEDEEADYDGTAQIMDVTVIDKATGDEVVTILGSTANAGVATATNTQTGEVFTATYDPVACIGPGTIAVSVTSSIYEGTLSGKSYRIRQDLASLPLANISIDSTGSLSSDGGIYTFLYTGSGITPTIVVKNSADAVLTAGSDYTVTYSNNIGSETSPETATVTITGVGLYSGEVYRNFRIAPSLQNAQVIFAGKNALPAEASNGWVSGYTPVYTGSSIQPSVAIRFNGSKKNNVIDTTTYGDNTEVSTGGIVTIKTRADSMFGVQTVNASFNIAPQPLPSNGLNMGTPGAIVYDGSEKTLNVYNSETAPTGYKVSNAAGSVLTKEADYTVAYANNTNAGTAIMTVTGKGNYTGTLTGNFEIDQFELKNPGVGNTIDVSVSDASYTGMAVEPEVKVTLTKGDGTTVELVENTDYVTRYTNNISIGTATATITGIQNFKDSIDKDFNIVARSITGTPITYTFDNSFTASGTGGKESLTFNTNSERVWNGYERRPGLVIKDGETVLKENTDYTLTFTNNINVSTDNVNLAKAIVTGKGNYAGSQTVTFTYRITKCPINADRIKVTNTSAVASVVDVEIRDTGKSGGDPVLVEGTHYEITMDTSPGGGVKHATITGKGDYYTGSFNWTYTVGKNLASPGVLIAITDPNGKGPGAGEGTEASPKDILYLGENRPFITISGYNAGADISNDPGFEITYTVIDGDDVNGYAAGSTVKAHVVATTQTNDYYGSKDLYYTVSRAKILTAAAGGYESTFNNADKKDYSILIDGDEYATYVPDSSKFTYGYRYADGNINPAITIYYAPWLRNWAALAFGDYKYTMVEDVDYTITPLPVEFPGTVGSGATYKIDGIGNFDGTVNITFSVANRDLTEIKNGKARGQIADIPDQVFEGDPLTPVPVVTYDGEVMTEGTDYKVVAYTNYTEPGSKDDTNPPTVTVQGIGNYTGTISKTFNIVRTELNKSNTSVTTSITKPYKAVAYTVDDIKDDILVRYDGSVLNYDTDYRLEFTTDAKYPGAQVVRLTPGSNDKYSVPATAADIPAVEFPIYLDMTDYPLYKIAGIENEAERQPDGTYNRNGYYVYSPSSTAWSYYGDPTKKLTQDGIQIILLDTAGNEVTEDGQKVTLVKDTNFAESWNNSMSMPGSGGLITLTGRGEGTYFCKGTVALGASIFGDLNDATVTVSPIQAYTGSAVKPVPSVSFGGQILSADNYNIGYESKTSNNFIDVLTDIDGDEPKNIRTVTISAKPGSFYSGSKSATYKIQYDLNNASITGLLATYTHGDIAAHGQPAVTVKAAGKELNATTDYKMDRSSSNSADYDCSQAGSTITVTITGTAGYSYGTATKTYKIVGTSIESGVCDDIDSVTYNGRSQTPIPTNVKLGGIPLVENTDYYLTYEKNKNAGIAYVVINGMGNYMGSFKKAFNITKKDISDPSSGIEAQFGTYYYAGGAAVLPSDMTLYDTDLTTTLNLVDDFTITASSGNTDVTSDASVTVKMNDTCQNYKGTKTFKYAIQALDLSSGDIAIDTNEVVYNGSDYKDTLGTNLKVSVITGVNSSNEPIYTDLTYGTHYKVTAYGSSGSESSLTNAGDYRLLIEPTDAAATAGRITGQNSDTVFTITPKPFRAANLTVTYTYDKTGNGTSTTDADYSQKIAMDYTGNERKMTKIVVKDTALDTVLVKGKDYEEPTYANNTDSGAEGDPNPPTVSIVGKGNYTDESLDKKYNIGTDISDKLRVTLTGASTFTYDGQEHKPGVTVEITEDGGSSYSVLDPSKYGIRYEDVDSREEDAVHAGTKRITVYGQNGYYGSQPEGDRPTYVINKKDPTGKLVYQLKLKKGSDGKYYDNYTGSEITPEVAVYDTDLSPTKSKPIDPSNYTVAYSNNTNVGTALVTITMKADGDYQAELNPSELSFIIKPIDFDRTTNVTISPVNHVYTGDEIKPAVTVTQTIDGNTVTLTENTDYTVSYTDNIAPGEATAIVTGSGNFNPTITKEAKFNIVADLSTAFDLEGTVPQIPTQFYYGSKRVPDTITATIAGKTLTRGEQGDTTPYDFYATVDGTPDWTSDTGYVKLVGRGKYYTGEYVAEFELSTDIEDVIALNFGDDEFVYTGAAVKPDGMVQVSGNDYYAFRADTDGVTYVSNTDAGRCVNVGTVTVTVPVTINGDDYEVTGTYEITPAPIGGATITYNNSTTYTGTARTADPVVTYNGKTLAVGTDYNISYANNIKPSEISVVVGINNPATFTLTGLGNFTDETTREFSIEVQSMRNVSATASGTGAIALSWDKKNYVTGYKVDVIDGTGAPVGSYLINNKNTTNYTITGLNSGATYSIRLMGYVDTTEPADRFIGQPYSVTTTTMLDGVTVTATSTGARSATLSMPAAGDGVAYQVYRSETLASGYIPIIKLANNRNTYTDTGLTSGKTYYYKVRKVKVVNNTVIAGPLSDPVAVTVR